MLKKLDNIVFSTDYIDLKDIESDIVTFLSDGIGLDTIDLNNINLDDDNFDEDYSTDIALLDLLLDVIDWNIIKHVKNIYKELMPMTWHPTRLCGWCMTKDEKKFK